MLSHQEYGNDRNIMASRLKSKTLYYSLMAAVRVARNLKRKHLGPTRKNLMLRLGPLRPIRFTLQAYSLRRSSILYSRFGDGACVHKYKEAVFLPR